MIFIYICDLSSLSLDIHYSNFVDVSLGRGSLCRQEPRAIWASPLLTQKIKANHLFRKKNHRSYDNFCLAWLSYCCKGEVQKHMFQTLGEGTRTRDAIVYPLHSLGNRMSHSAWQNSYIKHKAWKLCLFAPTGAPVAIMCHKKIGKGVPLRFPVSRTNK